MNRPVILDAGPFGKLAHPRPHPEITTWFKHLLEANITIIIPEITDYEIRRSLLLAESENFVLKGTLLLLVNNFLSPYLMIV